MKVNPLNSGEQIVELPIDRMVRSYYQPRELFEPEKMRTTRESIKAKGQLVPLVVRPIRPGNQLYDPSWGQETYYEIADGERRYRCCLELGFTTIKAVVRPLGDEQMLDYTLTTNDSVPLNPIERSRVFFRMADEFGKTQAEIAQSYNIKQQQVSEYIRLLDLPEQVQDYTARAVISLRHARELLKIPSQETRLKLAQKTAEEKLSTRDLSELVRRHGSNRKNTVKKEKISSNDISFEKPLKIEISDDKLETDFSGLFGASKQPLSEERATSPEESALVSAPIRKDGLLLKLFDAFIDFFGQLNALFIFGKLRSKLVRHMRKTPGLAGVKPENYLAVVEFCVLVPTGLFYALFIVQPIIATGLASFLAAFFLYRFWEKHQRLR
jgi:ParB family chromosome partitioning protein